MNKIIIIVSIFIAAIFASGNQAKANEVKIDNNQNGTITVSYNNSAGDKIKVLVEKSNASMKYSYDLPSGDDKVVCALTQGNGAYTVRVCKNISGTKYSILYSEEVNLNLKDTNVVFLGKNQIVDWESTNNAIKHANKITKNSKTNYKKIQQIYKYLVENYSYDYDKLKKLPNMNGYIPNIDKVFKSRKGICYDMSALNASMLRSLNIQTKLITGYSTNKGLEGVYHAWNKVYNVSNKKWIIMDVTYDMSIYKKVNYKAMEKPAKLYKNETYVY